MSNIDAIAGNKEQSLVCYSFEVKAIMCHSLTMLNKLQISTLVGNFNSFCDMNCERENLFISTSMQTSPCLSSGDFHFIEKANGIEYLYS